MRLRAVKSEGLGRGATSTPKYSSAFTSVLRITAYNKDFSLYVNEAIKEAGYPLDPSMDWANYIESIFTRNMPSTPEDLRDEAIHHTLITLLFERKVLDRFDATLLPEAHHAKPVEKQVSAYLKIVLILNISTAKKYLDKVYHVREEVPLSTFGEEGASLDKIFEEVAQGTTREDVEDYLHADIKKLRHAFHNWVDANNRVRAPKKLQLKTFFDLITTSDNTQDELLEAFSKKQGLSRSRASQILYTELPRYIRQFSVSPEGTPFDLAKRIPAVLEEKRHEQEEAHPSPTHEPILEEEPMQKQTSLKSRRPVKYAQFKRLATEDPASLSEALVELSSAFGTLAEASEALVENLDLTPVAPDAPAKEKTAAKSKFARMLKKMASDNPEAVEEAVNEIYNAVDEVAAAIENLAENLGFELHEVQEESFNEGFDEGEEFEEGEDTEIEEFEEGEDTEIEEVEEEEPAYEPEKVSSRKRTR